MARQGSCLQGQGTRTAEGGISMGKHVMRGSWRKLLTCLVTALIVPLDIKMTYFVKQLKLIANVST